MKRATGYFLGFALVLLLCITCSGAQIGRPGEQLFSFEGCITQKDGQPIATGGVELLADNLDVISATETDVDGRYMLLDVPLAQAHYIVRFAKQGYVTAEREVDIEAGTSPERFKFDVALLLAPPISAERGVKTKIPLAQLKVFYATDRKLGKDASGPTYVAEPSGSGLAFGSCDVSIPPHHREGKIEAPSIWRFEFSPDPEQHIVVRRIIPTEKEQFFHDLSQAINNGKQQQAFVFVHGYKVTFEDAITRTAQLAYDMRFEGVPIAYSWPSKGSLLGYSDDEKQVEGTKQDLKNFLNDLHLLSGAKQIYLIAHSMGNRALLAALSQLALETQGRALQTFKQVIFAAPDVAQNDFKQQTAQIARWNPHLTLYVSTHDQALLLSRRIHSGLTRAGDAEPPLIVPGLDTVDVSAVSTEFLGHTYYGDCKSVVTDIIEVFRNELVPRGLKPATSTAGAYWVMISPPSSP
jgi:esterase/lipase superfamily enzyme